ncbi:hypothetical protein A2U01_0087081, partial [Trifolium medium]|nr:hypothetical protein [Trifolium medium]
DIEYEMLAKRRQSDRKNDASCQKVQKISCRKPGSLSESQRESARKWQNVQDSPSLSENSVAKR